MRKESGVDLFTDNSTSFKKYMKICSLDGHIILWVHETSSLQNIWGLDQLDEMGKSMNILVSM